MLIVKDVIPFSKDKTKNEKLKLISMNWAADAKIHINLLNFGKMAQNGTNILSS